MAQARLDPSFLASRPPTKTASSSSAPAPEGNSSPLSRAAETAKSVFANRRPWGELLGSGTLASFSKPQSFADAVSRARSNVTYFHANYAIVAAVAVLLSFLRDPWSLVVAVAVCAAWCGLFFWRSSDQPLNLFGRSFSDKTVLGALTIGTALAVFFTGVFWNIFTALCIAAVFVVVHAVFRNTDDLFLDEEAASKDGLVSNGYMPIPTSR